jgi:hypothetical protein
MFVYEPDRTQDIVNRLVKIGNSIRLPMVVSCIVLFGAILGVFGGVFLADLWWIMALFGALIGNGLGLYAAALVTAAVEALAQSLVAQEVILARQKEKP